MIIHQTKVYEGDEKMAIMNLLWYYDILDKRKVASVHREALFVLV